jgi:hypothetical protein
VKISDFPLWKDQLRGLFSRAGFTRLRKHSGVTLVYLKRVARGLV